METTLSIIVPAFNEEENIEATVGMLKEVLTTHGDAVSDYEIVIIDNASVDGTGSIVDGLARGDAHIVPVHLMPNVGFGGAYWEGVRRARNNYVIVVPGDNETDPRSLENIFGEIGKADMIISYSVNPEVRSLKRRIISHTFTTILNIVLGLRLTYFNGVSMHRRDVLLRLLEHGAPTKGHGFNAEIIATLIKSGYSYKEVPMYIRPRLGVNKAFELKNIMRVGKTIMQLFWKLRILGHTIDKI